ATADVAVAHEIRHCRRVDVAREAGKRLKRLELGGKRQESVELRDVERLFPHAIARKPELTGLRIPHGKRKHARRARKGSGNAPLLECREQDFGVRGSLKRRALRHQLLAQSRKVVDLAVEEDGKAP